MNKYYFTLLFILVCRHRVTAQTIPGAQIDSCHKAFTLVPSSALTFKNFTFKSSSRPKSYSNLCQDSIRSTQSWFKFTTEANPIVKYRVVMLNDGCHIQLFKNTCGNLEEVFCVKMPSDPVSVNSFSDFLILEPNTQYFVKVGFGLASSPWGIAIQTISGRTLHSTSTGGFWHLPTTWQ